jgi:hypothetical protein
MSGVIWLQNPKLFFASVGDAPSTLHPSLVRDGSVSIADKRAVCLHRWTVSWCSFGKSKEHVTYRGVRLEKARNMFRIVVFAWRKREH